MLTLHHRATSSLQNRYVGDIGDYIKYALLRALSKDRTLGVAWYLFPDEGHNDDGRHISYLNHPSHWRSLDPPLFDSLKQIVSSGRSTRAVERGGVLNAQFARMPLDLGSVVASARPQYRKDWLSRIKGRLVDCDLVFADPDNGLIDNDPKRRKQPNFGKQLPVSEALKLSDGRPMVIYHHNTRFKGGHDKEVDYWLGQLSKDAMAIRATAFSCRTFFLIHPDEELRKRAVVFCDRWRDHKVRIHSSH